MKTKKFILNDEVQNSYGFKVLTKGINLERFNKNPVMLYEHNSREVIGKWSNVRIENNQLVADATFDKSDENALTIENKVNQGFLNGVSMGINILKIDESGVIPIVTECELREASICAIPSNSNALRLYDENGKLLSDSEVYTKLSIAPPKHNITDKIAKVLELSTSNQKDVLQAVQVLKADYNKLKTDVTNELQKKIKDLVTLSISEGRFIASDKDVYITMLNNDFENGKKAIANLPKRQRLTDMIVPAGKEREYPEEWTLSDYRKYAPNALKKDKELYQELIEKEYNQQ